MFRLQGIPVLLLHSNICVAIAKYICATKFAKQTFAPPLFSWKDFPVLNFTFASLSPLLRVHFHTVATKENKSQVREAPPRLWTFDRLKTCLRKTNLAESNLRTDCFWFLEPSPIPV